MNTKYLYKCLQETSNEVFVGHEETVVTDTVLQMKGTARSIISGRVLSSRRGSLLWV